MFTKPSVTQSMIDAVNKIIENEKPEEKTSSLLLGEGKKLLLEPKDKMQKEAMFPGSPEYEKKFGGPKPSGGSGVKKGSRYGGSKQKDEPVKDDDDDKVKKEQVGLDETDCVTPPQAKKIAKKEVKGHEKSMHKEELSFAEKLMEKAIAMKEKKDTFPWQAEEKEMSDSQMDKREKIVMSMKDKESSFKHRYGKNWKSVMYATATKQAMKEDASDVYEEEFEQIDEVQKTTDHHRDRVDAKVKHREKISNAEKTTDTLAGRVMGGHENEHFSHKINLKRSADIKVEEVEQIDEYGDTSKGQKMLTKVQKRAVDRVVSKRADTDPKYAKKNKETADRAWDRMANVGESSNIKVEEVEQIDENTYHTHTAHFANQDGEWIGKMLIVARNDDDAKIQAIAACHSGPFNGCKLKKLTKKNVIMGEEQVAPLDAARERAKKALNKIKTETMMGKIAGGI